MLRKTPLKRKARAKTKKTAKKKKSAVALLKEKCDKYCSLYIRQKYADLFTGNVSCFTCGKVDTWNSGRMHCGHYFSRTHLSTRFDEDNLRVQCVGCNVFLHGNYRMYSINLIKEKGVEFLFKLYETHKTTVRFGKADYEEMIEDFKNKIDKLK